MVAIASELTLEESPSILPVPKRPNSAWWTSPLRHRCVEQFAGCPLSGAKQTSNRVV